jgi:(1->4)-alpha-D-glucan 1-alpha-D-glucosylmutase
VERVLDYIRKAAREAKARTSWVAPDVAFERALEDFVRAVLDDAAFRADLAGFVEPLVEPGRTTSLAAKLLQITSPGIPDLYQGSELWTDSLVDPDNRRPVDFRVRTDLLAELDRSERLDVDEVVKRADEGLPKLALVRAALRVRRRFSTCFGPGEDGAYTPLGARGPKAGHLVGFRRGADVVVLVPRLVLGLGGDWAETTVDLPPGSWTDACTGDIHHGDERPVASLLSRFPVALLTRA